MQILREDSSGALLNAFSSPNAAIDKRLIATHLGRQIFLNRVMTNGADRGLWLHWCDPRDQGRQGVLKYGHCIAPNQTLEDALHQVYQLIEASIELETMHDPLLNALPGSSTSSSQHKVRWFNVAS